MLESIGFKFTNEVDPFDGGPHYRAPLDQIKPIKEMIKGFVDTSFAYDKEKSTSMLVSLPSKEGEFYSAKIEVNIHQINEENVIMTVEPNQSRYFNLKKGQAYTGIFL